MLKVLLAVHHRLDPNAGASGATLALGQALAGAGCEVEFFGFDHAFPGIKEYSVKHAMQFPWRLASFLRHNAQRFDVVDSSTGDNWVWAGKERSSVKKPHLLVTRSHGLEHTADTALRAEAKRNKTRLSWKYPVYHGGLRLWEVKQSIRQADHCFLLNADDQEYVCSRLHIPPGRVSVLPNGISDAFLGLAPPAASPHLALAFVGRWIERKGSKNLVEAVTQLHQRGLDFVLSLFGTIAPTEVVLADFPPRLHGRIKVQSTFSQEQLPHLLYGQEILLFPSLSEGFSLALVEAMACGLTPIATRVGGAASVIVSGENGLLIPVNSSLKLTEGVEHLASDRPTLFRMRVSAQETAQGYRWKAIARKTLIRYESLLANQNLRLHLRDGAA